LKGLEREVLMTSRGVSIKTRIIITLVLLPLVSLLVVGAIALLQNQDSLATQAEQNLARLLLEKASGYGALFTRIQQEVQGAGAFASLTYAGKAPGEDLGWRMLQPWTGSGYGSPELRRDLRDEILRLQRIGHALHATVSTNPSLTLGYFATESALTVFDNEGTVDIIEAIKGFDPRERPWYKRARQAGKPIWTDLYVDANTKKLTVTAAIPVKDPLGRFVGVAGLDVLLETLQADFLNIQIGYKNEPFMINREGLVLVRRGMDQKNTEWDKTYRTDNLLESTNTGFKGIIGSMVKGEAGIRSFTADDGKRTYVAYAPVPSVDASLGVIVPRSEIVRPVRESGKLVILVLALFLVVSVGIGVWLGNQVTRPVEELTVLVDKASKGLLEVEEIPIRRHDEVGVLAAAFNRMLANLSTVLRELEEKGKKDA
jgi:HAMP domain-containing protein